VVKHSAQKLFCEFRNDRSEFRHKRTNIVKR